MTLPQHIPPVVKVLMPLAVIGLLLLRFCRSPHRNSIFGWKVPRPGLVAIWVAVTAAYMLGTDWLINWRGPWDWTVWQHASWSADLFRVLGVGILGPIVEEMIFRGLLHFLLLRYLPVLVVVPLIAFAWAFGHSGYSVRVCLLICGFGLLLGTARQTTISLWVPIAMHVTWNLYAIW